MCCKRNVSMPIVEENVVFIISELCTGSLWIIEWIARTLDMQYHEWLPRHFIGVMGKCFSFHCQIFTVRNYNFTSVVYVFGEFTIKVWLNSYGLLIKSIVIQLLVKEWSTKFKDSFIVWAILWIKELKDAFESPSLGEVPVTQNVGLFQSKFFIKVGQCSTLKCIIETFTSKLLIAGGYPHIKRVKPFFIIH